jgi:molybdate transport system substrate-binding protein
MMRRFLRSPLKVLAIAALLLVLVAGVVACGSEETTTTAAPTTNAPSTTASPSTTAEPTDTTAAAPQELTVSAASSLKAAFTEIGAAFDKVSNATTTFNFDASGTLQKQIEAGAPVDVFGPAAMKQMNALVEGKFVDQAAVKVFASNEIVVVVPANSTLSIASFEDLTKADVKKVSYGDPAAAPHGVAAEEILTTLKIMDQVKPKVIYAANVSQALEYVTSGEVDAGIIFSTEAKSAGDKVKIVATSDASWHSKIAYPVGIVGASKNKELAQKFVEFVTGPEGQAILQKYGFLPAPEESTAAASGAVAVSGKVDKPATLTLDDLKKMTVKTITAEHPKKGANSYTGVLISDLMVAVGAQSGVTTLDMGCTDGYMAQVTLAELDPNCMLSFGDDGKLNAVMPGQTGKAWASDIVTMKFN